MNKLVKDRKKIRLKVLNKNLLAFFVLSGCFVFFAFFYKYHLFFMEQMQLFLLTTDSFVAYFSKPAAISSYLGEFLTQFYFLKGGGAIVITLCLFLLWWLSCKLIYIFGNAKGLFWLPLLIVLLTALLHCDLQYPLASTISSILSIATILGYTLIKKTKTRLFFGLIFIPVVYIISGGYVILFVMGSIAYEWKVKQIGTGFLMVYFFLAVSLYVLFPIFLRPYDHLTLKQSFIYPNSKIKPIPDFQLEKLLALDCEWYFNRPYKTLELAKKYNLKNRYASYYYNLANSSINQLPNSLLDYYQPGVAGLYIPLNSEGSYISIVFSNEVYFFLGDVNASQHCALLGTIFSPKGQSSRLMRRLVEINIINGEYTIAEKYINMLDKTLFHNKWAKEMRHLLYNESEINKDKWISLKRSQIPVNDYISDNPNDFERNLKYFIKDHPENRYALNYLLCYYLLNKDLKSFYNIIIEPIKKQQIEFLPKIYQEALLIYFAQNLTDHNRNFVRFSPGIMDRFWDYTNKYSDNTANGAQLQSLYGKTYWFYYHFAVLKAMEDNEKN
jgi:hypothetical protein